MCLYDNVVWVGVTHISSTLPYLIFIDQFFTVHKHSHLEYLFYSILCADKTLRYTQKLPQL